MAAGLSPLGRVIGAGPVMALLSSSAIGAESPCLKLVFGRYCLAGDVKPLLGTNPLAREDEGDSLALVFPDEIDRIYVLAYAGQIYKVVRAYRVATQLRYEELHAALVEKYGAGEDRSRFPADASTAGRRLAAIRRGEGLALHRWRPNDAWHIELTWTREMGLSLAYIADGIEAKRTAHIGRGL